MDMVKSSFDMCLEVEHGVKADGTLTMLCRYCCEHNIEHSYEISRSVCYDVVTFDYYDDVQHTLHWLEEKSAKE